MTAHESRTMSGKWRAAIDIGGTFTDMLLQEPDSGRYAVGKLLTNHSSLADTVRAGLEQLLGSVGADGDVASVIHATTLITNAIIERKGSRTALLVTEGFRDTLVIGRENRYDMYDVLLEKPTPLVPRRLTFGVPERILADGTVLRALDESAVETLAVHLSDLQVDAVAICLLHGYRFPEHERRVRELLLDRVPTLMVAVSHEVVGEQREYERAVTTAANAYVMRIVDQYLGRLETDLAELGHTRTLHVMLSSGSSAPAHSARAFPVRLVESGPAAGALGAAYGSRRMDLDRVLSFDMGGTTAKACLIEGGRPTVATELEVARLHRFKRGSGLPLRTSSIELIEIGAGGGSVARVDQFGLIQVGPDSAGSDPGPACYERGGIDATVTDADLVLGYLNPAFFLGGKMALQTRLASDALTRLADPLGLEVPQAAWAVHQVVNENMANAARIHAAEKGRRIEDYPLYAFGGAGPVHAFRVAKSLGICEVIAPVGAGVGSTVGLLTAPVAVDFVRTAVSRLDDVKWPDAARLLGEMIDAGRAMLAQANVGRAEVDTEFSVDMRLDGQAYEILVPLPGGRPKSGDESRIHKAFLSVYRTLYGRTPPNVAAEIVSWRVRLSGPDPALRLVRDLASDGIDRVRNGDAEAALKGNRPAFFPELGGYHSTPVYDRYLLSPSVSFPGPAIIEERESTVVAGPGTTIEIDDFRNVLFHLR